MAPETADTFPRLLLWHERARPNHPALREKDLGIWQTWTWSDLAAEVRLLAAALHQLGLAHGGHVAIIGENRPRLYAAMLASQSLGAIPVPMYQDATAAQMVYVFQDAQIAYAIVEDRSEEHTSELQSLAYLV